MKFVLLLGFIFLSSACAHSKQVNHKPFSTREVHFGFDKDKLTHQYDAILGETLQFMTINVNQLLVIEGHTDLIGPKRYNLDLGDRRAREVKSYLVSKGVEPSQIVVVSYGEQLPISRDNMAANRRAVIRLP